MHWSTADPRKEEDESKAVFARKQTDYSNMYDHGNCNLLGPT